MSFCRAMPLVSNCAAALRNNKMLLVILCLRWFLLQFPYCCEETVGDFDSPSFSLTSQTKFKQSINLPFRWCSWWLNSETIYDIGNHKIKPFLNIFLQRATTNAFLAALLLFRSCPWLKVINMRWLLAHYQGLGSERAWQCHKVIEIPCAHPWLLASQPHINK